MALRPRLATGLPFRRMGVLRCDAFGRETAAAHQRIDRKIVTVKLNRPIFWDLARMVAEFVRIQRSEAGLSAVRFPQSVVGV